MSAVGKNRPHDSARSHVSGESIYIDDIAPAANELLVDFYASPSPHGRIKSLDLSDAAKIPGVVGLYTYKDLDGGNRLGPIVQDEVLLAEEICQFIGQPLVVIAAESRQALREAKAAIKCQIEELTPTFTCEQAIAAGHFIGPVRRIKRGDVESAFAAADNILEGVFESAGQDHFYLESQAALVYPGEGNCLVVHSSTQAPTEVQEVVAHLLGLKANQVVCLTKRLGGGFGGKESQATHPAVMAALVALRTRRPARIVYSKDQDMQVTGKRHPFRNKYKVAFTKDGLITALKFELYADGGAAADLSPAVVARALTHSDNAYFIPTADIAGFICKTNRPPNTAFRGFGAPQGIATIENVMEEIAIFLKKDPLDIRLLNCYGTDERNTTPYREIVRNNTLPRIFEELSASSSYRRRRAEIEAFNAQSATHLKGIAFTPVKFGISFNTKTLNQASSLVNIYVDGTIQVSTGAVEMGQGVNTSIQQLVAGEFDIDQNDVAVMPTSTEKNNNSSPTAASTGTDLNGSAAVDACVKIKQRLAVCAAEALTAAEPDLQKSASSIVFENGQVFDNRRPENKMTFPQLVKLAYLQRISLGERGFYATAGLDWNPEGGPEKTASGNPFLYYTMGASVSEVLIDRFTGHLQVTRADILMDIGKPINPGIARGQITGAFIQGMGWVTTEELKYADSGELLSHSPTTYKIPNIQDTPKVFNVNWIDNDTNQVNIKGSKAFGEPPFVLGLSVWAAVKHALTFALPGEIPRLKLPATGEEILRHLSLHKKSPTAAGGQRSPTP